MLIKRVFKRISPLFIIVMCLILGFTPLVIASNELDSIENAKSSINNSFTNLLAAEKVGGNTTEILSQLRIAGEFLTQAEAAYNSGDFANASIYAGKANLEAQEVNDEALALQASAGEAFENNFLLSIAFSIVAALIFSIILLLFWKRFKRSYMNKLLKMKPEVIQGTA